MAETSTTKSTARERGASVPLFSEEEPDRLNDVVRQWLRNASEPPIILMACGRSGAGRSTFLNHIFTGKVQGHKKLFTYNSPFDTTTKGGLPVTKGIHAVQLTLKELCDKHHLTGVEGISPSTMVLLIDTEAVQEQVVPPDFHLMPYLLALLPVTTCCLLVCNYQNSGMLGRYEADNVAALVSACNPEFTKKEWGLDCHPLVCVLGMHGVPYKARDSHEMIKKAQQEVERTFLLDKVPTKQAQAGPEALRVFCFPQILLLEKKAGVDTYWETITNILQGVLDHARKQPSRPDGAKVLQMIEQGSRRFGSVPKLRACGEFRSAIAAVWGQQMVRDETEKPPPRARDWLCDAMRDPAVAQYYFGRSDLSSLMAPPPRPTLDPPSPKPTTRYAPPEKKHRETVTFAQQCGKLQGLAMWLTSKSKVNCEEYANWKVQEALQIFGTLDPDDPIHKRVQEYLVKDVQGLLRFGQKLGS